MISVQYQKIMIIV